MASWHSSIVIGSVEKLRVPRFTLASMTPVAIGEIVVHTHINHFESLIVFSR